MLLWCLFYSLAISINKFTTGVFMSFFSENGGWINTDFSDVMEFVFINAKFLKWTLLKTLWK